MKTTEVHNFIETFIPRLYKFAYVLIPDSQKARDLVTDAYSVFIVRETEFIKEADFPKTKKASKILKRFFVIGILNEIYNLALKKGHEVRVILEFSGFEYRSYNRLTTSQRAVLYLNEKTNFTIESICQVTGLDKSKVLENLYNAKEQILKFDETEGAEHGAH